MGFRGSSDLWIDNTDGSAESFVGVAQSFFLKTQ